MYTMLAGVRIKEGRKWSKSPIHHSLPISLFRQPNYAQWPIAAAAAAEGRETERDHAEAITFRSAMDGAVEGEEDKTDPLNKELNLKASLPLPDRVPSITLAYSL